VGGSAQAGDSQLFTRTAGVITITGDVGVDANAFGGGGISRGGNATGGLATISTLQTTGSTLRAGTIDVQGSSTILAQAFGGSGATGGTGTGGVAVAEAVNGAVRLGGFAALNAGGEGGFSRGASGIGGAGIGGRTEFFADSGGTLEFVEASWKPAARARSQAMAVRAVREPAAWCSSPRATAARSGDRT
jgi:hypothetical protein